MIEIDIVDLVQGQRFATPLDFYQNLSSITSQGQEIKPLPPVSTAINLTIQFFHYLPKCLFLFIDLPFRVKNPRKPSDQVVHIVFAYSWGCLGRSGDDHAVKLLDHLYSTLNYDKQAASFEAVPAR